MPVAARHPETRLGRLEFVIEETSVSVERGLLTRSDALARSLGISRAALIERGLKHLLAEAS